MVYRMGGALTSLPLIIRLFQQAESPPGLTPKDQRYRVSGGDAYPCAWDRGRVTFGNLSSATGIGWAKTQFIEVHLEVFATDAVMGADQPLVEITNGRIRRRRHNRLRTLSNGFAKVFCEGRA